MAAPAGSRGRRGCTAERPRPGRPMRRRSQRPTEHRDDVEQVQVQERRRNPAGHGLSPLTDPTERIDQPDRHLDRVGCDRTCEPEGDRRPSACSDAALQDRLRCRARGWCDQGRFRQAAEGSGRKDSARHRRPDSVIAGRYNSRRSGRGCPDNDRGVRRIGRLDGERGEVGRSRRRSQHGDRVGGLGRQTADRFDRHRVDRDGDRTHEPVVPGLRKRPGPGRNVDRVTAHEVLLAGRPADRDLGECRAHRVGSSRGCLRPGPHQAEASNRDRARARQLDRDVAGGCHLGAHKRWSRPPKPRGHCCLEVLCGSVGSSGQGDSMPVSVIAVVMKRWMSVEPLGSVAS